MASQSRYTNASLLLITREKETLFIYIIISLDFCYLQQNILLKHTVPAQC